MRFKTATVLWMIFFLVTAVSVLTSNAQGQTTKLNIPIIWGDETRQLQPRPRDGSDDQTTDQRQVTWHRMKC